MSPGVSAKATVPPPIAASTTTATARVKARFHPPLNADASFLLPGRAGMRRAGGRIFGHAGETSSC
jgi:hypothetical protein